MDFVKKIVDIIQRLVVQKFTGEVWFALYFNKGGIRDAKKLDIKETKI